MKAGFEILPHTADIGITASGKDRAEAFVNAARGMFSIIVNPAEITSAIEKRIAVTAPDRETLLVNWLNELNFISQTAFLLFRDFKIRKITDTSLKTVAIGEKTDTTKHHLLREIKAVTYHHLLVEQQADGWHIQVIFDI